MVGGFPRVNPAGPPGKNVGLIYLYPPTKTCQSISSFGEHARVGARKDRRLFFIFKPRRQKNERSCVLNCKAHRRYTQGEPLPGQSKGSDLVDPTRTVSNPGMGGGGSGRIVKYNPARPAVSGAAAPVVSIGGAWVVWVVWVVWVFRFPLFQLLRSNWSLLFS